MSALKTISPLWRLSHAQQKRPSYLLGSMHVKDPRAFTRLRIILEGMNQCEVYAAEHDFSEVRSSVNEQMYLPSGTKLSDYVSETAHRRIQELWRFALGSSHMPLKLYERMLPLVQLSMITAAFAQQGGYETVLDQYLWQEAQQRELALAGVETFEEQLDVLASIPIRSQLKDLMDASRNRSKFRRQFETMATLYASNRLYELHQLAKKSLGKSRRTMLYDRNIIMTQRIEAFVTSAPTFMTVGLGHLFGGKGILRLLKHRGLVVQPVV